jgi:hypothetical protein
MFKLQDHETELRNRADLQWKLHQNFKVAAAAASAAGDVEEAQLLREKSAQHKKWFIVAYDQLPNRFELHQVTPKMMRSLVKGRWFNPLTSVSKIPPQFRGSSAVNTRR